MQERKKKSAVFRFQNAARVDSYKRFEETMRRYVTDLRDEDVPSPVVAMMIKELQMLWGDVEDTGVTLSTAQENMKQGFDREVSLIMAGRGLVQEDIDAAHLFTTSTGRRTASPVFARRMN